MAYDAAARIVLRDSAAKAYLDDLQAGDAPDAAMPQAVAAALARLHWRPAGGQDSDEADDVALRAQGRSGRWYTLHAALSEPDEAGASRSVVILSPATATETAGILARLYGLARRERTVLLHLCRGRSTKEIAAELGPSAYTVQEYIRSACEKVGARDQKALVSRMLFDGKAAASLGAG